MSDPSDLPANPDDPAPAGITRRHALRKLAYVAPAVVALEVVTSQKALGQSGPVGPGIRPPDITINPPDITINPPDITINLPGIRPNPNPPAAVGSVVYPPATTAGSTTMVVTNLPSTGSGSAADDD